MEEEISAVDPGRVQLRLLDELDEIGAGHAEFTEPRGRVYAEHSADLAVAHMIIELGREVRVGQPVAIGYRLMLCIAEIARDSQLAVFQHRRFWACMDTQRDHEYLTSLWESGKAPWAHTFDR